MRFAWNTLDPVQIRDSSLGDLEETCAGLSSLGLVPMSETHMGARSVGSQGERREGERRAGRRSMKVAVAIS